MRYNLFPEEGTFYKANLHSHTNISDGKLSPVEMRDLYRDHGYSILAITDHEIMMDHTDLSQPGFLMINGYEIYLRERQDAGRIAKNCHINLIAKTPTELRQIAVDPKYLHYIEKNGIIDYSMTEPKLGTRASHGCIRVQRKQNPEPSQLVPGDGGGIWQVRGRVRHGSGQLRLLPGGLPRERRLGLRPDAAPGQEHLLPGQ